MRPTRTRSQAFWRTLGGPLLIGCHCLSLAGAASPVEIERLTSPDGSPGVSAVRVRNAMLVHTTQLLPRDLAAASQNADVLKQLDLLLASFGSARQDVVKLNLYVQSADVRDAFLEELSTWANGELPAVTTVATRLPAHAGADSPTTGQATVALDAVFVSRRESAVAGPTRMHIEALGGPARLAHVSLLPRGDVVYVSGQADPGELQDATRLTLGSLERTLAHLGLSQGDIVQLKCFLQPMTDVARVNQQIAEFFGEATVPPVSHVEWISGSLPIEIELIAWAPPAESDQTVSYSALPWMTSSPVYSRVARVHGDDRLYVGGLSSTNPGDGAAEVQAVFNELQQVLAAGGSDLLHLAKATYYVSSDEASGQLNALRPTYYDPTRPPAASKAMVGDVGIRERTLVLDMIAGPASR